MPETIEAEVIEIDGVVPRREAGFDSDSGPGSKQVGGGMRGAVLRLDRKWWPVWLVLGVLAVILLATVGVVVGVCYVIYSLVRALIRSLLGGVSSGHGREGSLSRD